MVYRRSVEDLRRSLEYVNMRAEANLRDALLEYRERVQSLLEHIEVLQDENDHLLSELADLREEKENVV